MMTVKECYESMEADFEGVIGRMGSEEMVKRFALKFLDDPSYSNLEKAIQEQNAEEAFRAAHRCAEYHTGGGSRRMASSD